jgi:hypothetical protein
MDIFEQMENATLVRVNGVLTENFGWNADDPDEDWCFSVYAGNMENYQEYYITKPEMESAKIHDDGFLIQRYNPNLGLDETENIFIEFMVVVPVSWKYGRG